jgi:hypothetical protein
MYFLKHKQQSITVILLLIVCLSACTHSKSKLEIYGTVFSTVIRNDNGIFRGYNLGDKLDSVQSTETGKPLEMDTGYLYYENKIDSSNINIGSYNITYNFDDSGLNEIQSDIFIKNADRADEVFNKFKSYFDEHYGASETHMGFNVWTVKSTKYNNVRINLSDESSDFSVDKAPAKISLWIYPDKD